MSSLSASARHWRAGRIMVAIAAAITLVGAFVADVVGPFAAQHIFNANWPPHAKFHDAQYIVMSILLGTIALAVLSRKRGDSYAVVVISAAVLSTPWLGMFGAMLFPGTAMIDPEFDKPSAYLLGMHPQVPIAGGTLLLLLIGVLLAARDRNRR
jgi:hypothetical protein